MSSAKYNVRRVRGHRVRSTTSPVVEAVEVDALTRAACILHERYGYCSAVHVRESVEDAWQEIYYESRAEENRYPKRAGELAASLCRKHKEAAVALVVASSP